MTPYYSDDLVTLYHGDCREWMPEADVIVTDPPYGIAYHSQRRRTSTMARGIAGDADSSQRDDLLARWDGPALVFGSYKVPAPLGTRMVLVWDKGPALGMGALDLPWKPTWDLIFVVGKGFVGRRDQGAVLRFSPVQSQASMGRLHVHEKPLSLMRYLIQRCPPGTVLDPFMGSGSTLVAAKSLGRRSIGIEVEERYCEVAARRCSQEVLSLSEPMVATMVAQTLRMDLPEHESGSLVPHTGFGTRVEAMAHDS